MTNNNNNKITFEEYHINSSSFYIEECLLSCIFNKTESLIDIIDIFQPIFFEDKRHRSIYEAMLELFMLSQPIEIATVLGILESNKKIQLYDEIVLGNKNLIEEVKNDLVNIKRTLNSSIKIKDYANILISRYELRILKQMPDKITEIVGKNKSPRQIREEIMNAILQEVEYKKHSIIKQVRSIKNTYLDDLEQRIKNPIIQHNGIEIGFPRIDSCIDGLYPGYLMTIAGGEGVGKSNLSLDIVLNVALKYPNLKILFFSLEMTEEQLKDRLISKISGISSEYLKQPKLYFLHNNIPITDKSIEEFRKRVEEAISTLDSLNIFIDDSGELSANELVTRSKKFKLQNPELGLIVIDYAGKINNGYPQDHENIPETYIKVTRMAKSLKVATILLSQFATKLEGNKDKFYEPSIFHLAGGASARKESHIILMMWRPSSYSDLDLTGNKEMQDKNQIIIGKVRESKNIGRVNLEPFDGIRFKELI
jgi:replicative DNA helicase